MYRDGSQRKPQCEVHRNLSNPQTPQKIKCTNINMQYNHFSSESLVQFSVTYSIHKKQCTRSTILCMRLEESSLHAARQAFSTDASCKKGIYSSHLQCMHAPPATTAKGRAIMHFRQHLPVPLTLYLAH